MERWNLLCDKQNCGQPASHFSLQGNTRTKTCHAHTSGPAFPISAQDFIRTPEDGLLYKRREALVGEGRQTLGVMEEICEKDWKLVQEEVSAVETQMVDTVKRSVEGLMQVALQRYEEVNY